MSTVTCAWSGAYTFEIITSLLQVQDTYIIAAKYASAFLGKIPYRYSYGLFMLNEEFKSTMMFQEFQNIPDMAMVGASSFAFIDQGWFTSDIHLVELQTRNGKRYWHKSLLFSTDGNCRGICIRDNCYFLTFSGYFNPGHVKMMDSKGTVQYTFETDSQGKSLFSWALSKIYVDSEFRMHVSDIGKKQLTVIKVSSVGWIPQVEAEYDNTEVNCIIQKSRRILLLAIGGQKNEVVMLSKKGPKKAIRENELKGIPTALCLVGDVLLVATQSDGWFSPQSSCITAYKDSNQIRREECIIAM